MIESSMGPEPDPSDVPPERSYGALIILGILAGFEIVILYLLIAIETPLSPIVQRLMKNPAGVFTLVMIVVTLLSFATAGFFGFVERVRKGRSGAGRERSK
jgi:hypothetical protein